MKALTNLESLDLSGTEVTSAGFVRLDPMVKLATLGISGIELTDEGVAHLNQLPNLRELDVEGLPIRETTMSLFPKLKKIEHLNLWNAPGVTDEQVKKLKLALPNAEIMAGYVPDT